MREGMEVLAARLDLRRRIRYDVLVRRIGRMDILKEEP